MSMGTFWEVEICISPTFQETVGSHLKVTFSDFTIIWNKRNRNDNVAESISTFQWRNYVNMLNSVD